MARDGVFQGPGRDAKRCCFCSTQAGPWGLDLCVQLASSGHICPQSDLDHIFGLGSIATGLGDTDSMKSRQLCARHRPHQYGSLSPDCKLIKSKEVSVSTGSPGSPGWQG